MINRTKVSLVTTSSLIALLVTSVPTSAQTIITSDGSTGSLVNSSLTDTCTGGVCLITGGTNADTNLFHSLSDFSLSSGDEVQFESNAETIFTRVTGGNQSNLDGLIRTTNPNTDLFLLNPNGILFGPNATLDIGGSFISSTADSIVFDNGTIFSARQSNFPNALLNIQVPIGLQYGDRPGDIQVQGNGNNLFLDPDTFSVDRSERPVGLEVTANQTLGLIGGNITFSGGNITASSGHIEIGSVGANNVVNITPTSSGWQFQYDDVSQFQDIKLAQAASLDISGEGDGTIQVRGQRLSLAGGSVLLANTTGIDNGATISVETSRRLTIKNFSDTLPSGIFNDVAPGAAGNSGSVAIATGILRLANGGQISATTFGAGTSGGLSIDAQRIHMSGNPPSFIFTNTGFPSTGQGGDMVINVDHIDLNDGSQIITSAFGTGIAGNLMINAQSISGSGIDPSDETGSGIVSLGIFGEGGDITINTETLALDTGAFLSTGTLATANAGNVIIQADTISLSGAPPDLLVGDGFVPSSILTIVNAEAPGNGGDLTLRARTLHMTDGAQVISSTFGLGNAGMIQISADRVNVVGTTASDFSPSGIFAQAEEGSSGAGSSILLHVDDLFVEDGGQVAVGTFSVGDAGELVIDAETITLAGTSTGTRSGLFANAIASTGNGGDLFINADRLMLQDGASISASNFQSQGTLEPGQGAAGNITINAPILDLDNEGLIIADTAVGNNGHVDLQTQLLVLRNGSRISTNAASTDGGNIEIDAGAIAAFNNSDISANALDGFGGRVVVSTDGIFGTAFRSTLTPNNDITASSALGASFSGEVVLNTPDVDPSRGLVELPETFMDISDHVTTACEQSDESSLVITGTGGMPQTPYQTVQPQSIWSDTRLSERFSNDNRRRSDLRYDPNRPFTHSEESPLGQIQEAQAWWVNDQGNLVLGRSAYDVRTAQQMNCGLSIGGRSG